MSDSVDTASLTDVLARLHADLDELYALGLTSTADADLLDAHREFERFRRRLDAAEYRIIAEETRRKLPDEYACRSTGRFLRHLLHIEPAEANARVRAAAAAGPRQTLVGAELGPVFEHVAAAQQAGSISQRHALLIEQTIDALPDVVQAERGDQVERDLVGYAAQFDPRHLSVLARRMSACLDPDGTLSDPDEQQRRRAFTIYDRADGSARMTIAATAELTARMRAFLDTFARPRPADELGNKDTRTIGQRQHDALLDLLEFAQRADDAPTNNGVSMTVVLTMTTEQYLTGKGLCRTAHGALVPTADALTWSGGDHELFVVAINSMKAITHYSDTHRIFSRNQRLAMGARDGGCSFPGCPEPPGRCQSDHVVRWEHGRRTRADIGQLVCRYHHANAEKLGWRPVMVDGLPHWIPPSWIDPAQQPVRNTLHDHNPAVGP